jgi:hypothetical protein
MFPSSLLYRQQILRKCPWDIIASVHVLGRLRSPITVSIDMAPGLCFEFGRSKLMVPILTAVSISFPQQPIPSAACYVAMPLNWLDLAAPLATGGQPDLRFLLTLYEDTDRSAFLALKRLFGFFLA